MSTFPCSTSNGDLKSTSTPSIVIGNSSSSSNNAVKISNPIITGNSIVVATSGTNIIAVGSSQQQQNQDEDKMNLSQLLACFPEPPSFSLINRASQQRKDTIFLVSQPSLQSKQSVISDAKLNQIIQNTIEQQSSPDKIIINDYNHKLERSQSVSHPDTLSDTSSSASSHKDNSRLVELITNESLISSFSGTESTGNLPTLPKELIDNTIPTNNNNTSTSTTTSTNNNNTSTNTTPNTLSPTISLSPSPILSPVKSTTTSPVQPTPTTTTPLSPPQQSQPQPQQHSSHQTIMLPNHNNSNASSPKQYQPPQDKRVTISSFGNFPKGSSTPSIASSNSNSFYQTPKWDINLNQLVGASSSLGSLPNGGSSGDNFGSFELYMKACKNELLPIEFNRVLYCLLESKLSETLSLLEKCYESLSSLTSSSLAASSSSSTSSTSGKQNLTKSFLTAMKSVVSDDLPLIKLSKIILYFGYSERTIPTNQEFTEDILISNTTSKKLKFKVNLGAISKDFTVTTSVKDGVINKKSNLYLTVAVNLKTTLKLRKIITIEIEGGFKYFVLLQIESGKTAFGQNIEKEELIDDSGYKIPKTLFLLKQFLVESSGLTTESIFRQPPSSNQELYAAKEQFSKDPSNIKSPVDPNVVATLIKMYFRELPECLLSAISPKTFLDNDFTGDETLLFVNQISDIKRTTFLWLINLLADVSKNEAKNKMNSKNLAIIFAPNLYITPGGLSPEDSIAISGKVINFILQMMNLIKNIEM